MKRTKLTLLALVLGLGALAWSAPALRAGTVFMKNGYIIQGPIVDRTEGKVILGWPYGKVTIERRFFDSVVLEPTEEEAVARLRADEAQKRAEAASDDPGEFVYEGTEGYQLPSDFVDLVDKLNIPVDTTKALDIGDGNSGPAGSTDEPPVEDTTTDVADAGDSGTQVEVTPVEPVLKRAVVPGVACSLLAPAGWESDEGDGYARWSGEPQDDAFVPGLVIVTAQVEDLDVEAALDTLRAGPTVSVRDFEVVREEQIEVHGRDAFLVVGRGWGRRPGAHADSDSVLLRIRQVLVPGSDRFWVISSFVSDSTAELDVARLEKAVESVRFEAAE